MEATKRVWQDLDKEYKETHILHEIILKEGLERPMHYNEMVLESILKWSNWPEEDRKHNYLILKGISEEFKEALKSAVPSCTFSNEVNYSPNIIKKLDVTSRLRNKSEFKKCLFEVKGDYLVCSKKLASKGSRKWTPSLLKQNSIETGTKRKSWSMMNLAVASPSELSLTTEGTNWDTEISKSVSYQLITSWLLKDICWYYGTETKRQSPSKFNIVFIVKNAKNSDFTRSRSHPFLGDALSFETKEMCIEFVAALLLAEHNDAVNQPGKQDSKSAKQKPSSESNDHCIHLRRSPCTTLNNNIATKSMENQQVNNMKHPEEEHYDERIKTDTMPEDEQQSLNQLMVSLSFDKAEIDKRMSSGKHKEMHLSTSHERSNSF